MLLLLLMLSFLISALKPAQNLGGAPWSHKNRGTHSPPRRKNTYRSAVPHCDLRCGLGEGVVQRPAAAGTPRRRRSAEAGHLRRRGGVLLPDLLLGEATLRYGSERRPRRQRRPKSRMCICVKYAIYARVSRYRTHHT